MALLCPVKPSILRFLPRKQRNNLDKETQTNKQPLLLKNQQIQQHIDEAIISEVIEYLIKYYKTIYKNNRIRQIYKKYLPPELPNDIYDILYMYEYDELHSFNMYIQLIHKRIHSVYIIPFLIGITQFIIISLILSQAYQLLPQYIHYNLLYYCGIILLIVSSIQFIFAFRSLLYIEEYNLLYLKILKNYIFNRNIALFPSQYNNKQEFRNTSISYLYSKYNEWELFIEFEKWCNILYVVDLTNKNMKIKNLIFTSSVIWMYLCKPLFCIIGSIFLIQQTVEYIMWIWIPYFVLTWYIGLHSFLRRSSAISLIICLVIAIIGVCAAIWFHGQILNGMTVEKCIRATMYVFVGQLLTFLSLICYILEQETCTKKHIIMNWICSSILCVMCYLAEWVINVIYNEKYVYHISLCTLRLCGMYFWYISFNLIIFISGNCNYYQHFDKYKFIKCFWLFGWFDMHSINSIFHK